LIFHSKKHIIDVISVTSKPQFHIENESFPKHLTKTSKEMKLTLNSKNPIVISSPHTKAMNKI
jgi:hypothetical protein